MLNPRVNYSWIAGRQSFKTGYEYQAINTQIDDFNPKYGRDTYGGQFSRPAGAAADPATYNLADFMFGARSAYSIINPFIANLRQRMHFALPAGRLQGEPAADAEPRRCATSSPRRSGRRTTSSPTTIRSPTR